MKTKKTFVKNTLVPLLTCGSLTLLMAGAQVGSTPSVAQAAEKSVPLTATIHYAAAVKTLAGTKWQLTSPAFEGASETPFLNFTDARLSAGVGLNSIGGQYSTSGSKIEFLQLLSTKMAGPPELMKAEDRFLKALSKVKSFEISQNGKQLTLRGGKTLTFEIAASADALENTAWQLVSPAFEGVSETPFLNFADWRVNASVGLNSIGGKYSTNGSKIVFPQLISTKMAGPPALMKAENRFLKALDQARSFEISQNGKLLTLRGGETLTFKLAAADALANTEWELVSPALAGASKMPYLNFTDSSIGAGVGLNIVGGEYSTIGSQIQFGNLLSTQMAGPPELMQAERRFLKALEETKSYELSSDGKTLVLQGAQNWTFRLKANTPQGFVATETKIINVAPRLGPEMDGDKKPKYLQLEDLSNGVSWGRFTEAKIEGFDFEPGYRYQLRVTVERNARTNEKRLRLVEIFSQRWMESSPLKANHKILEVAPTKIDCVGVGKMQCLQVREQGGEWQAMHAPIHGFDFQAGWRYRLQVAVSKVKNPPADASNLRYTLVRLLDKMPVTY